jgi:hypothetical protein
VSKARFYRIEIKNRSWHAARQRPSGDAVIDAQAPDPTAGYRSTPPVLRKPRFRTPKIEPARKPR